MKPLDRLSDDEFSQEMTRALRQLPDAPAAWQQAAIGLYPAAPGLLQQAAQALLNRITAVLTFDSAAGPALAHGMRSASTGTRHLLFSARGRDIDLRITAVADAFAVAGQVLGPDEGGQVELSLPGALSRRVTALDDMGEFRIDGVERGLHVLVLTLGADEIVLPPIDVG